MNRTRYSKIYILDNTFTIFMAKNQSQVNLRLPSWMFKELRAMGNYSEYIRDLILNDRTNKNDPKFIDKKIEEYEKEIKRLEKLLHSK